MGLLAGGLILVLIVFAMSSDATVDARRGQDHYWECRRQDNQFFAQQARETDTYHTPGSFGTNKDFYHDGSLKRDSITGKTYSKGQYYCRSDGMKADYSKDKGNLSRPPQ